MGLWDAVKRVALSTKCATGFHSGEWSPIAGEPECHLEKTCPDCDKYLTKIEHNFDSWQFLKEKSCDSIRSCIYCNEKQNSVRHYSWVTEKIDCKIYRECERCKTREFVKTEHGPWYAGIAHPDGMQDFTCSGCGITEERKFDPHAR